jgi:hypothetical protein
MVNRHTQARPHELRDVACSLIFMPALTILAGNIELRRFDSRFWISLTVARVAWLSAYRKWALVVCFLGLVAFRFTFAFVATQRIWNLYVAAPAAALTVLIFWTRRHDP